MMDGSVSFMTGGYAITEIRGNRMKFPPPAIKPVYTTAIYSGAIPMASRRTTLFLAIIIFAVALASLAGCGQKGDLYLPSPEQEKKNKR